MNVERQGQDVVVDVGSEAETEALGRALAGLVEPGVVIALIGPLGVGKTRLARALAEALGVDPEAIASPTFVLIHEYEGALPVYHFDAYRLRDSHEFEAIGASDYWQAGGVCLVEWADRVRDRIPADAWAVTIEPTGPSTRRFRFHAGTGDSWTERLSAKLGLPFDAFDAET